MKLFLTIVCLTSAWLRPAAAGEPGETESKQIAELRSKADQGDADAQFNLGAVYVFKEDVEAVKWFRKAAEQRHVWAQFYLAGSFAAGRGVKKDATEALKWFRKAADQGNSAAQFNLGVMYYNGEGTRTDKVEAASWHRMAAEQGLSKSQVALGSMYRNGEGVPKDHVAAGKWYRMAAEQGDGDGQFFAGVIFADGRGVAKNEAEAYKWWLLSGAQGNDTAKKNYEILERNLTPAQRAEGQRLAREFRPRQSSSAGGSKPREDVAQSQPQSSGTGFFITDDGYFITNQHVAGEGATVRVLTAAGTIPARVVKVDQANDLALLKAEGKFTALPVIASRGTRLGATVATVGFPNIGLQGFAPKLAKGEIASLAGAQDDARHFQISAPIQPGNSGGALVDERGNVIGVVVAKLSQQAALATSGTLAENVNYAVKSSYLLSFLESVPEVAAQLKEPNTRSRPFEDVVKDVEQATVLVLVY